MLSVEHPYDDESKAQFVCQSFGSNDLVRHLFHPPSPINKFGLMYDSIGLPEKNSLAPNIFGTLASLDYPDPMR